VVTAREERDEAERELSSLEVHAAGARAALEHSEAEGVMGGAALVGLLKNVQQVIQPPAELSECPVCRQPVGIEELRQQVAVRVAAASEVCRLAGHRDEVIRQRDDAAAVAEESRRQFLTAVHMLANQVRQAEQEAAPGLCIVWHRFPLVLELIGGDVPLALEQAQAFFSCMEEVQGQLADFQASAQKDVNLHNAVSQHHERVKEGDVRIHEAHLVHERLNRAVEIVRTRRHTFTQTILDAVTVECNRLYGLLHPEEPLGLSNFRLDEGQRASLLQEARFLGYAAVPPQAYFSESHLDTLGFCLFLALAKVYSHGDAIIVLDDVFTSVDQAHLRRVVDLIAAESACFNQIIITTHYRRWRDQYRYLTGPASNVELIELSRWTGSQGVKMKTSLLAVEELEQALQSDPLDRQSVAAKAGILLEAALDHLTYLYRCRVPRTRDGENTLGDLSASVAKLLKELRIRRPSGGVSDALVDPPATEEIELKSVMDGIVSMCFVRNEVGCHFNASGADISDDEICAFGHETLKLVSSLVCSQCGDAVRRPKGTHYACSCGVTQMTPLEFAG
jgi:hypothetical protein